MPRQVKEDLNKELEDILLELGADVVGFADVSKVVRGDIAHLRTAISIGINRRLTEKGIEILEDLERAVILFLRKRGYRYLAIPPDSDRKKDKFISRLYPLFTHKIAATSSGLGWIGRNGLFISPEFGPRLSLATVLTDAPFKPGRPIEKSLCGECLLCVKFCPAGAIKGRDWSVNDPYGDFVDTRRCNEYKKRMRAVHGKPNCGLCINICPFGRNNRTVTFDTKKEVYQCQSTG
jgi:epoxyqueuosine reductase